MKIEKLKHFAKSYLYGLIGLLAIIIAVTSIFLILTAIVRLIKMAPYPDITMFTLLGLVITVCIGFIVDKCRKDKAF